MTQSSRRIAVTGGIGSGKSALLCHLGERFPVFSCDEINRRLLGEEDYLSALRGIFPDCFEGGALDRKALSEKIFSSEEARERLNALSHPLILARLARETSAYPLSFSEVPLLFECGLCGYFDGAIVVLRDRASRVKALLERGLGEEEIARRMAAQRDWETLPHSDEIPLYFLKNDGNLEELFRKADEIAAKLV